MFIARLPLSVFIFYREKKNYLNKLFHLHTLLYVICIIATTLFLKLPQANAAFMEQMAIDPVAISLANTVTADPPGISSIHYNPAGLSHMGDGNFISLGVIPVSLNLHTKFTIDKNLDSSKVLNDLNGNPINPINGQPGQNGQMTGPTTNEGSTTSGLVYVPLLDTTINSLAAPVFGLSHRTPGSNWTFGFSSYAPFAAGFVRGDPNDLARYDGSSIYMQHLIYAAPAVSYKVNSSFSVGAAFGLGQTAMGLQTNIRDPNEITNLSKALGDATQGMANPVFDLTIPMPLFGGGVGPYDEIGTFSLNARDDFSPSFNLGALWEPFDWVSFGLCYQSPIKSHLSGKYSFQYSSEFQKMVAWSGQNAVMTILSEMFGLPYESTSQQTGTATMDIELPQTVSVGIKLKPVKRLSLLADLHWANWSSIKQDNMEFDQEIQLLQLAKYMGYQGGASNMILTRNFKDTLNWGVGIEYQVLDWLTFRAGYENRKTSTVDQYFDLIYDLPSVDYYGAGLGIKLPNNIDIDLALGYMVNKSYTINDNGSSNLNSTQLGNGLLNPYRGLDFEQELDVYMGAIKATMPLNVVTGLLYKGMDLLTPSKWRAAPAKASGSLKADEIKKPVDSSSTIINNLRPEEKNYYTEDSE